MRIKLIERAKFIIGMIMIIITANDKLCINSMSYDGRRGTADDWHVCHVVGSSSNPSCNEKIKTYFSVWKLPVVNNLINLRGKIIIMIMVINTANDRLYIDSISFDGRRGTADAWHVCHVAGSASNPSLAENSDTEKKNWQT